MKQLFKFFISSLKVHIPLGFNQTKQFLSADSLLSLTANFSSSEVVYNITKLKALIKEKKLHLQQLVD